MRAGTMTVLAMAALLAANPALAQQAAEPSPEASAAPVMVAASADLGDSESDATNVTAEPAPAADQGQQGAPVKPRRAARVTSCRCGTPNGQ